MPGEVRGRRTRRPWPRPPGAGSPPTSVTPSPASSRTSLAGKNLVTTTRRTSSAGRSACGAGRGDPGADGRKVGGQLVGATHDEPHQTGQPARCGAVAAVGVERWVLAGAATDPGHLDAQRGELGRDAPARGRAPGCPSGSRRRPPGTIAPHLGPHRLGHLVAARRTRAVRPRRTIAPAPCSAHRRRRPRRRSPSASPGTAGVDRPRRPRSPGRPAAPARSRRRCTISPTPARGGDQRVALRRLVERCRTRRRRWTSSPWTWCEPGERDPAGRLDLRPAGRGTLRTRDPGGRGWSR